MKMSVCSLIDIVLLWKRDIYREILAINHNERERDVPRFFCPLWWGTLLLLHVNIQKQNPILSYENFAFCDLSLTLFWLIIDQIQSHLHYKAVTVCVKCESPVSSEDQSKAENLHDITDKTHYALNTGMKFLWKQPLLAHLGPPQHLMTSCSVIWSLWLF